MVIKSSSLQGLAGIAADSAEVCCLASMPSRMPRLGKYAAAKLVVFQRQTRKGMVDLVCGSLMGSTLQLAART